MPLADRADLNEKHRVVCHVDPHQQCTAVEGHIGDLPDNLEGFRVEGGFFAQEEAGCRPYAITGQSGQTEVGGIGTDEAGGRYGNQRIRPHAANEDKGIGCTGCLCAEGTAPHTGPVCAVIDQFPCAVFKCDQRHILVQMESVVAVRSLETEGRTLDEMLGIPQ